MRKSTVSVRWCPRCKVEIKSSFPAFARHWHCCGKPGHISCSDCNLGLRRMARVLGRLR